MKALAVMLACIILAAAASSSNLEKYSEVRIFARTQSDVQRMQNAGLFIDHANTKLGQYSDAWLSASEIALLKKSGVPFQILIEDWDAYYASLPTMTQAEKEEALRRSAAEFNVSHSIYGSMGGYLTYAEVVAKLDSMRAEFPTLISQKFSIGTTYEGRTMWAVRITKNPDTPTGRPEVFYHALIHAREPESMETQMYYFYWLFENYGTNPLATYILENREIYWLPVFNVDGYVYNQTTNPTGGGNWRANRHITTGSCGPVDLNRNYGIYQFWNSSNGGSSTDPCSGGSGTYRGTAPFSELETQNVMNFVNSRHFNAAFGAHTYGNYLIKPWAWSDPTVTPDDYKYIQYLADMKASNPVYTTGTPSQTVGYFVRGGSDDWYYNDSVHTPHHIIAVTPETGNSFWPAQNLIIPLAQGMLYNNQYMSLIAGSFVNPLSTTLSRQTYEPGQSGTYKVVFRNKGVLGANNVVVRWTSANSGLSIPTTQFTYPTLASFGTDSSVFTFTLSSSVQNNTAIPTQLTIQADGATIYSTTVYVLVGNGVTVLSDSANSFANWTRSSGGTWNTTTTQYSSPPSSFTDSPSGNYGNNIDNSMILLSPLNAAAMPVMTLSFTHKYATEAGYDFCIVEVSSDNGTTWQSVASYNGTLSTWTRQTLNISNYANGSAQTKIRFRLTSDASQVADGWYVDDVVINGYPLYVPPPDTGIVVSPSSYTFNGATGRVFRDSVKIKNLTSGSVTITLAESLLTTSAKPGTLIGERNLPAMNTLFKKLQHALQSANITRESFQGGGTPATNPDAYTTILTDERGENGPGAADIYRVQYQYRNFLNNFYHDFKIVLGNLPDSNALVSISVDTDQEFRTGSFPAPIGIGTTARDIGAEREVIIDASGVLIDSVLHIGRIPAGVVVRTDSFTVVGNPFLVSIQRDSVFTITTESLLGGINANTFNDPDRKMNLGFVASHYRGGANPFGDLAPAIGHANIGGETGVSWLSEDTTTITLASQDSATVRFVALAAKSAGTYRANVLLQTTGRTPVTLPFTMNVTTPPNPAIQVTPTTIRDTLALGDSVVNTLSIRNTGGGTLNFIVLDSTQTPWVTISPILGSADSGATATVSIRVLTAGLTIGSTYSVPIVVISNDPQRNTTPITFTVYVKPPTSVNTQASVPTTFALHQNYPNPFNPETNISFDVPRSSFVTLKVYNLIGQEVGTIVHQQLPAGTHTYKVGNGLSSGVYLYRLTAEGFVQTRKMILLR